jgi:hypothetical protein
VADFLLGIGVDLPFFASIRLGLSISMSPDTSPCSKVFYALIEGLLVILLDFRALFMEPSVTYGKSGSSANLIYFLCFFNYGD